MLTTFTEWKDWQSLLQKVVLVVQSRYPGDQANLAQAAKTLEQYRGRIVFADAPVMEVASSDVRAGRLSERVLPPLVRRIRRENHLYKEG